jgi:DNA polymerase III subunit delta
MAKEKSDKEIFITEAFKEIRNNRIQPIYLLFGEENYLINELVDLIIEKTLDENLRQLNVEKFSGNDTDSETITTAALSIPMLAEKKVVIVKNYDKINDSKSLQFYLQNPSQSTVLILISESIDKRKNVFAKISQNGILVQSQKLKKNEIIDWIDRKTSKLGKKIAPEASDLLVDLKGDSLQEIYSEIDKLVTFTSERKAITRDDVLAVIGSSREFNIFELINSVGQNNKVKTIQILENLLNQNIEPIFIISMLSRHFILLWKTTQLKKQGKNPNEIAVAIQVNPYFVKDYISQSEKFSLARIEKCLKLILESDLILKSASLPKRIVIENLICQLLDPSAGSVSFINSNNKVSIEI